MHALRPLGRRDPDDPQGMSQLLGLQVGVPAFVQGGERASGRRSPACPIHDLRHTAACLWLAKGVPATTVQAWMGHASIATTNIYLHHLGTVADEAGLARLNGSGGIRGESAE